jgi:hypothetical protein
MVPRWFKTKCLSILKTHNDMGMDDLAEYKTCILDLNEVESFMDDEDHNNEACTQLKFKSGESFSIELSIDEFEKMIYGR